MNGHSLRPYVWRRARLTSGSIGTRRVTGEQLFVKRKWENVSSRHTVAGPRLRLFATDIHSTTEATVLWFFIHWHARFGNGVSSVSSAACSRQTVSPGLGWYVRVISQAPLLHAAMLGSRCPRISMYLPPRNFALRRAASALLWWAVLSELIRGSECRHSVLTLKDNKRWHVAYARLWC